MIKNVIMIVLDTLQFNYLGCYGNEWIRTPKIDRLAAEGVLFENAYTEGSPTIPTRRAMMTGRYSLPFKGWGPLDPDDTTVADICMANQCRSAFYYDTAPMHMYKYGYQRGFDEVVFRRGQELDLNFYRDDPLYHLNVDDFHKPYYLKDENGNPLRDENGNQVQSEFSELSYTELLTYLPRRQYWIDDSYQMIAKLVKRSMAYFDNYDAEKPFLFWLDSFDPHEPWDPPSVYDPDMKCPYDPDYEGKDLILPIMGSTENEELYTEEELHHIRMLYAEKITTCDKWVGKLIDHIKSKGLYENSMIILTTDHGQPLGNGIHGHGIMRKCRPWPYEELVHIPLIIRVPGVTGGQRIKPFVSTVDMAPTMMDWMDIEDPIRTADMQGQSLLPIMRGQADKVRDYAIVGYHGFSWGLVTEEWSYIHWLHQDRLEFDESNKSLAVSDVMMEFYDVTSSVSDAQVAASLGDLKERTKLKELEQKEEIWTCTPGSTTEVPEIDELYNRGDDPFQQNNLIKKHPEIGLEMLKKLREIMIGLKAG
ncbi:MAG: sulfatase-like hydrolase/transferase [Deltaproteobacteria bacterium]|nr:sulfatase-like hydrolase/transferase [Deltaproteobacteria bacterium]MBW1847052.1 sulfatase-like hydrolase/transferase [Deltaproteobacteria bacterium]